MGIFIHLYMREGLHIIRTSYSSNNDLGPLGRVECQWTNECMYTETNKNYTKYCLNLNQNYTFQFAPYLLSGALERDWYIACTYEGQRLVTLFTKILMISCKILTKDISYEKSYVPFTNVFVACSILRFHLWETSLYSNHLNWKWTKVFTVGKHITDHKSSISSEFNVIQECLKLLSQSLHVTTDFTQVFS